MSNSRDKLLREQAIRERAFYIWEQRGLPAGKDLDNWLSAEAEYEYEFPRSWAEALSEATGRAPARDTGAR